MEHRLNNYRHGLPECSDGDTFTECNLSQLNDREIATGKTGLIFSECNLTNCIVPDGSTVLSSNRAKIDFCYWLHPEWVLPVEPEDCRHVIETDILTVDGQSITEYIREDTYNGVG